MNTIASTSVSFAQIDTIDNSVESIVEFSKKLLIDKQNLKRAKWHELLDILGWTKEVAAKYIKIGEAFEGFDASRLSLIEPHTLFKITSSKRFAPVVKAIRNAVGHITEQFVEHLIKSNKPQAPAIEVENPTIWRAEKNGSRTCVIPPIKEDDYFTGMAIQRAMEREGISAQSCVREAMALREALSLGAIQLDVRNLPDHLRAVIAEFMHLDEVSENEEVLIYEYEEYECDQEEEHEAFEPATSKSVAPLNIKQQPIAITVEAETPTFISVVQELSIEEIEVYKAELLACQNWEEVMAIVNSLAKDAEQTIWQTFTLEQRREFKKMKFGYKSSINNANTQASTNKIALNEPSLGAGGNTRGVFST